MTEEYNQNEPIERRYLEIEHYGLKENIRIKDKVYNDGSKILSRRGKDDRPQDYDSRKKVRGLTKVRIKKKLRGLDNIL
jgi:hypothetical protein